MKKPVYDVVSDEAGGGVDKRHHGILAPMRLIAAEMGQNVVRYQDRDDQPRPGVDDGEQFGLEFRHVIKCTQLRLSVEVL